MRERVEENGVKRSGDRRHKSSENKRYPPVFGHFGVGSEGSRSPPNRTRSLQQLLPA